MEALNSEQSTLRVRGNVRGAEEDHSVEEFFQPRATVKLHISSTFAPLTASKDASASCVESLYLSGSPTYDASGG